MRSSAPAVAELIRVQEGQMLHIPPGARVTILYRSGAIVTLEGDQNRVRVPLRPQAPRAETMQTALARPDPLRLPAATRAPEGLEQFFGPTGDFHAELTAGCTTERCRNLRRIVETRHQGFAIDVRRNLAGEQVIQIRSESAARLACWRFDPERGAGETEEISIAAQESAAIVPPQAHSYAPSIIGEAFIGCIVSTEPLPAERKSQLAGAASAAGFMMRGQGLAAVTIKP